MMAVIYSIASVVITAIVVSFCWLLRINSFRDKVETQVKDSKRLTDEIEKMIQHKEKDGDK